MTEQKSQAENLATEEEKLTTDSVEVETTATTEEKVEKTAEQVEGDALEEAIARVQELEAELVEANKKEQDLLLRTRAEIDNIRRRTEQDIEKAHKFALEKFAKEILTVIDNLERALSTQTTSEDESIKAMFEGVDLTLKHLLATVAKFGIEAVGAEGETFNPELHQAISMQPAEGFSANQITTVLQKGYLLNGRVIRPAMVMVAA
ncbi:nucleotide exchange factor GrpE [Mergibacter septicus]|uniref:Protein GrpE n=1 Tax=Mergibacter septicus TaxID=221402 RepID=A0A8E3MFE3_9PAST|nr:nucleotide exchange factor GrpE [Mergibacter septicus]AWX14977.1 nucleotide exchange factor GrpE [Mergibacter septicus]QDJ14229.1 nucleotide exchange factor GrpE [Mergibacter septicus]UTU48326.1 nucleotide exchange factor GrpE [Mergibacter septicus]WMR96049.1 nucleotide exchange factor GrpE [Mergibacter septicus]